MNSDRESAREQMVAVQLEARGIRDRRVLDAFRRVPRECFVPEEGTAEAYGDHALPIGLGQTISQPYIVAFMTESLRPKPDSHILEIGTGSGYQAAVLAELVEEVDTVELVPELAEQAEERLRRLGYNNVHVSQGDGYSGWPQKAPFDAILVTAAAEEVPPALTEQLKEGGKLILPIGAPDGCQELTMVTKREDGGCETKPLMSVRFVPFQRGKSDCGGSQTEGLE